MSSLASHMVKQTTNPDSSGAAGGVDGCSWLVADPAR
jgi:hypothetical protein